MSVSINRELLSSIQSARQRYHCDLEAKRKQSEREQLKVNKKKEAAKLNEKVNLVNGEIKLKESGLAVADHCISEGNQKLQNELTSSKMSKEKLQHAQSMISMGLSRERKLESEIRELEKERENIKKR